MIKRALDWIGRLLPVGLALSAAILVLRSGGAPVEAVFSALAGAMLGMLLSLLLRSAAVLTAHVSDLPPLSNERLVQLELDKRLLLRSIKEIELDGQLDRIDDDLAQRLLSPLRERTIGILRQIDEARVGHAPASIEQAISKEVQLRLAAGLGLKNQPAAPPLATAVPTRIEANATDRTATPATAETGS